MDDFTRHHKLKLAGRLFIISRDRYAAGIGGSAACKLALRSMETCRRTSLSPMAELATATLDLGDSLTELSSKVENPPC